MKTLFRALSAVCLFAGMAAAQANTSIVATQVRTAGGGILASGRFCLTPSGTPSGTGVTPQSQYCATVTSGVTAALSVPNASTVTSPYNLTYTLTITDSNNGNATVLTVPGMTIAGASFNWSTYTIPAEAQISGEGIPYLACNAGAQYTQTDAVSTQNSWLCTSLNGTSTWYLSPPQVIGGAGGGGSSGGGSTNANLSVISVTLTFGSIIDGTCADQTFSFSGVTTNTPVYPIWPPSWASGLVGNMFPIATNTVDARVCNLSGAGVTLGTTQYGAAIGGSGGGSSGGSGSGEPTITNFLPFTSGSGGATDAGITRTNADTFAFGNGTVADASATISASYFNGSGANLTGITAPQIDGGAVKVSEFNALAGVTGPIQTQINNLSGGSSGTVTAPSAWPPASPGSYSAVSDQQLATSLGVNGLFCGFSTSATDNSTAWNTCANLATAFGYGYVYIPTGEYKFTNKVYIPTKVHFVGSGQGDPNAHTGTVLTASASMDFLVQEGQNTNSSSSVFRAGISNLTINCNGQASGGLNELFGEEEVENHELMFLYCGTVGYQVMGADVGVDGATGASQNNGPDWGIEVYPYQYTTSNTIGIRLHNVQDYRGLHGATVVMQLSTGVQPTECAEISGTQAVIEVLHMEGCGYGTNGAGLVIGPATSPMSSSSSVGMVNLLLSQASLTTNGGGPAVRIMQNSSNDASGITIQGVGAGGTNNSSGYTICDSTYIAGQSCGYGHDLLIGTGSNSHISRWNMYDGSTSPLWTFPVFHYGFTSLVNTYQMELKYDDSNQYGCPFFAQSTGRLEIGYGGQHGCNWVMFDSPQYGLWLGNAANGNGLNLVGAMTNSNSAFKHYMSAGVYWDPVAKLWQYPGDGSGQLSGIFFRTTGAGGAIQITNATGQTAGTISDRNMQFLQSWYLNVDGSMDFPNLTTQPGAPAAGLVHVFGLNGNLCSLANGSTTPVCMGGSGSSSGGSSSSGSTTQIAGTGQGVNLVGNGTGTLEATQNFVLAAAASITDSQRAEFVVFVNSSYTTVGLGEPSSTSYINGWMTDVCNATGASQTYSVTGSSGAGTSGNAWINNPNQISFTLANGHHAHLESDGTNFHVYGGDSCTSNAY